MHYNNSFAAAPGNRQVNQQSTQQSPSFELMPAFSVPIVSAYMPNPDALNSELRRLFLEKEKDPQTFRNPHPIVVRNKELFESRFDLFDWPEKSVATLRSFCFSNLTRTIQELCGYDQQIIQKLSVTCESWFHITRNGGYFAQHNHPLHSWSGVYCVKHDGDNPQSASGKLVFMNPHQAGTMYIDMGIAKMKPPFNMGHETKRLVPGQLVLFPSWLPHEVWPYEGYSERITVAFNARFKYSGKDMPFYS